RREIRRGAALCRRAGAGTPDPVDRHCTRRRRRPGSAAGRASALMLGRGLINRAVATFVAAGAAFVAMVALGATVYYLLLLVVPPVIAAALTALLFALIAAIVALVFVRRARGDDEDEEVEEPEGLGARALHLFQQRPILGAAAALAGGFIFLRNPALATIVAAASTEKSRGRRRR